ncbi:MAG: hypothetical protein HZA53_07710 [Planctomycetes bacterium]|nr:hypothetical protein [Planctomycetota bacterium]
MARVITELEAMNEALAHASFVLGVDIAYLRDSSRYSIEIVLGASPKAECSQIVLQADGLVEFQLKSLGGGLSQFSCLRIEDVRERQLDRIRFRVRDIENDRIEFLCSDVRVAED